MYKSCFLKMLVTVSSVSIGAYISANDLIGHLEKIDRGVQLYNTRHERYRVPLLHGADGPDHDYLQDIARNIRLLFLEDADNLFNPETGAAIREILTENLVVQGLQWADVFRRPSGNDYRIMVNTCIGIINFWSTEDAEMADAP